MPLPHTPPFSTAELLAPGGRIGPHPADFVVDEVPLYAASGTGEHLYVRIEKTGMTTRDAVRELARATGVPVSEIGTAGMKDKHAVTTQWVSLPARKPPPPETWELGERLRVLEVSRHGNKLRTGHLTGNRFAIRLVGVEPDALARARSILDRIAEHGLPNYFGAQRFGHGGRNLDDALAWLGGEAEGGASRRRVPPFERKLFASVVQSDVFNRYVTARLALGTAAPIEGEVLRLHGTGSLFVVDDVAHETPRFLSRDTHPTGPMIGPRGKAARGRALELEEEAVRAISLEEGPRAALARYADGTRRDVLVWPEGVTVTAEAQGELVVIFFLPSGSYATELVRELTRAPFLGERMGERAIAQAPDDE